MRFELLFQISVECFPPEERTDASESFVEESQHGLAPSFQLQQTSDDAGDALPMFGFSGELFAAGLGNGVEPRLAVVLGYAPLRGNPALIYESHEAQIDSALIDLERILPDLLNAASNAVAVLRSHGVQGFQHHEIESALKNFRLVVCQSVLLWDA